MEGICYIFVEGHLAQGGRKKESLLVPGVVNPVIASGCFASQTRIPIMAFFCSCQGDNWLLVPHEWSRSQGQRYGRLDSVAQVKPVLHTNLLLALWPGILHAMYTTIKVVGSNKAHPWHKYLNKHLGRYKLPAVLMTAMQVSYSEMTQICSADNLLFFAMSTQNVCSVSVGVPLPI